MNILKDEGNFEVELFPLVFGWLQSGSSIELHLTLSVLNLNVAIR